MLLKKLTQLNGVSGDEEAVREFILNEIKDKVDEIKIDSMGNLIAFKKGKTGKNKVMLSAHMDEVGFMVTGFGEGGTIKFKPVGGIDERILPGKRVLIGEKQIPGVIGIKAVHMQDKSERQAIISQKKLYIDIGVDKKEEAEKLISLGEFIAFHSEYTEFGDGCVKAKALDDRVGCSIMINLLDKQYDFDLYAAFTVQEEVGLRGAEIAAYTISPDIALILEGTTCGDLSGIEEYEHSTNFGQGPALTIMDRTAIVDKKLLNFIVDVAEKNKLKYQFKRTTTGGNDAGKIQRSRSGVRVASISVPCRYIHSPVSMMKQTDYDEMKILVEKVLNELPSLF